MLSNFEVKIQDIQDAAKRIEPYVHKTPVMTSSTLDRMAGRAVHFKCEIFQKIGAFKVNVFLCKRLWSRTLKCNLTSSIFSTYFESILIIIFWSCLGRRDEGNDSNLWIYIIPLYEEVRSSNFGYWSVQRLSGYKLRTMQEFAQGSNLKFAQICCKRIFLKKPQTFDRQKTWPPKYYTQEILKIQTPLNLYQGYLENSDPPKESYLRYNENSDTPKNSYPLLPQKAPDPKNHIFLCL